MEGLLTPLRTISTPHDEPLLTISKPSQAIQHTPDPTSLTIAPTSVANLDDVISTLRSKPSAQTLSQILVLLTSSTDTTTTFDIRTPSLKASQVVATLFEVTVPDFWNVVSKQERTRLSGCLRSVAGLGGVAARLRLLVKGANSQPRVKRQIEELLDLLQAILGAKGVKTEVWITGGTATETRRGIVWKEFVTLVAGGRVLSIAAEAETILGRGGRERWVGNGKMFTAWLGREIARASARANIVQDEAEWKALSLLLSRGFSLGYSGMPIYTV